MTSNSIDIKYFSKSTKTYSANISEEAQSKVNLPTTGKPCSSNIHLYN